MSFDDLIATSTVAVCAGTGGVGKTTCAAAIAFAAAQKGRRAVVVTIDPARRLGDAMGLDDLHHDPQRIKIKGAARGGELWALMLDTKATFDQLVRDRTSNAEQAQRIFDNRYYQSLSTVLSGTQEFMAIEKLYELQETGDYDLIVVDTPPSRNALDFLDAPRALARFLNGRLLRLITPSGARFTRAVTGAAHVAAKAIGKIVGARVVDDVFAFVAAFAELQAGFLERSAQVEELLGADSTAFVLVTSPRGEAVDEGLYFAERIADDDLRVGGLVVNRMHPRFDEIDLPKAGGTALEPFVEAYRLANAAADAEEAAITPLLAAVGDAAVAKVPMFGGDVHDLDAIAEVSAVLTSN